MNRGQERNTITGSGKTTAKASQHDRAGVRQGGNSRQGGNRQSGTNGNVSEHPLLQLQRAVGNQAACRMVVQRKVSDHGYVVLSDDMVANHVAADEKEARAKTNTRVNAKDVNSNTVIKGTVNELVQIVGEGDDKHYEGISDAYGLQWIANLTVWHYETGTKGASGYLIGEADEEKADVQLKLFTKAAPKPLVRVTGINDVEFI